jgi:serine/threonine protein kinase
LRDHGVLAVAALVQRGKGGVYSAITKLHAAGLNVPSVFFTFHAGGDLYAILELIPGEDCFALFTRRGRVSCPEVLWLGWHILPLLEYLNARKHAWRDLKPHNLIVEEDEALGV